VRRVRPDRPGRAATRAGGVVTGVDSFCGASLATGQSRLLFTPFSPTPAGFLRATRGDPWPAREAIRLPGLSVFPTTATATGQSRHFSPRRFPGGPLPARSPENSSGREILTAGESVGAPPKKPATPKFTAARQRHPRVPVRAGRDQSVGAKAGRVGQTPFGPALVAPPARRRRTIGRTITATEGIHPCGDSIKPATS
jgi:hypothetical protein